MYSYNSYHKSINNFDYSSDENSINNNYIIRRNINIFIIISRIGETLMKDLTFLFDKYFFIIDKILF